MCFVKQLVKADLYQNTRHLLETHNASFNYIIDIKEMTSERNLKREIDFS